MIMPKTKLCIKSVARPVVAPLRRGGCTSEKGVSGGSLDRRRFAGAVSPEVFDAVGLYTAAQTDDGVGPLFGPEHTGLFEPLADDMAAPGLDHARANEQSLVGAVVIAHAVLVLFKVGDFVPNILVFPAARRQEIACLARNPGRRALPE